MFPADAVPDGAVFAPHHYIYGVALSLLVVLIVWDNYPDREPLFAALGAGSGLFGFLFVWQYYPVAGALLALLGPCVTIAAIVLGWTGTAVGDVWDNYPTRYRLAAVFFSLVALDDAVEHAFGWWTPLDALWAGGLSERAPLVAVGLLGALVAVGVVYAVWTDGPNK